MPGLLFPEPHFEQQAAKPAPASNYALAMSPACHGRRLSGDRSLIFSGTSFQIWNLFTVHDCSPNKVSYVRPKFSELVTRILIFIYVFVYFWSQTSTRNAKQTEYLQILRSFGIFVLLWISLGKRWVMQCYPSSTRHLKKMCTSWRVTLEYCVREHTYLGVYSMSDHPQMLPLLLIWSRAGNAPFLVLLGLLFHSSVFIHLKATWPSFRKLLSWLVVCV